MGRLRDEEAESVEVGLRRDVIVGVVCALFEDRVGETTGEADE
jgi:hypothetical protein